MEKRPRKSVSAKEKVYDELKEDILTLKLSPGEPLREQELATRFGVSRTPVREALTKLNHEGLVEIIHQKGAFVARLDFTVIREIYQLREVLEGLAARLAASRIDFHKLEGIEKRLNNSEDAGEIEETGWRLHEYIIEAAGNKRLAEIVRVLGSQITRVHHFAARIPGRTKKSLEEHKQIIGALKKRDAKLAEMTVKKHIVSAMESTFRAVIKGR